MIRKKNFAWWSKFNYVLSSALDSGTALSVIFVFFTLQVSGCSFFSVSVLNYFWLFLVSERWGRSEVVG